MFESTCTTCLVVHAGSSPASTARARRLLYSPGSIIISFVAAEASALTPNRLVRLSFLSTAWASKRRDAATFTPRSACNSFSGLARIRRASSVVIVGKFFMWSPLSVRLHVLAPSVVPAQPRKRVLSRLGVVLNPPFHLFHQRF